MSDWTNGLALRLFALIVVPLLGLGLLAIQRIDSENGEARTARALVEDARLEQTVAAVYAPAQLEQIALEGLAAADAYGLPRDLVVTLAGADFSLYTANTAELDDALAHLDERFGPTALENGETLTARLDHFRSELDRQRALSSEGTALQTDVRSLFTGLDEILAGATASAGLTDTDGNNGIEQRRLAATSVLLRTAGDRGRSLLEGLIDGSPGNSERSVAASAQMDLAVEQLRLLLGDTEADELDLLVRRLEPLPPSISGARTETLDEQFDPDFIEDSTGGVINQIEFLELLESYAARVADDVVGELSAQARQAEAASERTRVLVAATVTISLALLSAIAWSILRPLRRLTRRAADISDGAFDVEPLPERGPHDVRVLTHTMNSMAATLRAVDHEIADLASGADGIHDRRLPGTIGISIAQSFERLEAMTSRLHASRQLAASIVEQAADAIWTIDETGVVTSANSASVELIGVPAHEQIGNPLADHIPRTDGEMTIKAGTPEQARLLVASSEITGGEQPLTTVIARDISERMRFEERLAYQAHHDGLTGLPNRFAVLDELGEASPVDPVAVLFVDLDGFKSVNDTQGHMAGDRVLTEVGRRLSTQVRQGDFVGRLGGDEFVVVMNDISEVADAVAFARRLITQIELPYLDEEHLFTLSACVGVSVFTSGLEAAGSSPLDAIQRADSAVYAAKRRGRGRVEVFDEQLQAQIVSDAEVEIALRNAVRNEELTLHFQPVLDTVLGRFTSAEALVRWNRPGVGMVPPGAFIPIAERSSLIAEIGRWVLTEACQTLAGWSRDERFRDLRIAVNVAGSHLLDGDLVADLDAAIELTGANPQLLEFELTETQLMDDHERAALILEEIRRRGVTVAIDDFGTGYSSMAYLRELPIDTLKIDRSFIDPIGRHGTDTTVVDALLTIGHALGLSVVAEGIETAAQLAYVTRHGADRAQGFHLARPVPIDEVEELLVRAPAGRSVAK